MQTSPTIIWFRHDLRLDDNPALDAAVSRGGPVVCLYVLETGPDSPRMPGGASKWWLDKSLRALAGDIEKRGGRLILRRGNAQDVLDAVIAETGAQAVVWNRRYDAPGRKVDEAIKTALKARGLAAQSENGRLLNEPWGFKTGSGGYYKVFTPYWKAVKAAYEAPDPLPVPAVLTGPDAHSDRLDDWALHPTQPDWSGGLAATWRPGEAGAQARLDHFLAGPVNAYPEQRNRPDDADSTSGLSPHLAWGEISPARIWRATKAGIEERSVDTKAGWKFLSELVWREFSHVLLYHNPDLAEANYKADFDGMPWHDDDAALTAWQAGQTGYPLVDAAMRALWQTGWMHNRLRMVVASFLTKHLLVHWRHGEAWFWDTLVDGDVANNAASWQWVAGSGADAAPYFRIFNPITQGEKFDPDGIFVRHWCPELAGLPISYLMAPWQAPRAELDQAGVRLGDTYPEPLIDHRHGRARALEAYETLKQNRETA